MVIWIMSGVLYAFLLHDTLRKTIDFFGKGRR